MRLGVLTLAPLEIAVRRRSNSLAVHCLVVVHRHAHRATGVAPLEPCFEEDAVEPFLLGLVLDMPRTGYDQRSHPFGNLAAPGDSGGSAQILDAAVGAPAAKHPLHL